MHGKYLKEILGLSIFAAMAGESNPFHRDQRSTVEEKLNEPVDKVIPAGCKEYTFYGITVVAISEKSARKKIAKRLKNGI